VTVSARLQDALLAARSVVAGAERERPANDWWGVTIARRHLEALAELADEYIDVAGREPDSAIDDALREAPCLEQGRARPSPPRMTTDDVGDYYVYEDGSIWQLVSFSDRPTATLERVNKDCGPDRRGGVVGAPVFAGFRKLVPEDAR
jgi:hypothetical protein